MLVWFGIDYYMVDPGSFWESVVLKPQMEKLRNLDEEKKEGKFTFKVSRMNLASPRSCLLYLFLLHHYTKKLCVLIILEVSYPSWICSSSGYTIPILKDMVLSLFTNLVIIIQYLVSNDCVPGLLFKCFMCINCLILKINVYLILKTTLKGSYYYNLYFLGCEIDTEKLWHLPRELG